MKSQIVLLFFGILLISCSKHEYSAFERMGEDNRWLKSDAKVFEFEITDDSKLYDLSFEFSHVYGYHYTTVPIIFSIKQPNGAVEYLSIDLALKDPDGKELADCSGDVCDLEYTFREKATLTKGKYKLLISHNFEGPYLPNIIGIGLNVDDVKR